MAYTKKGFTNPFDNIVVIDEVYTEPIVIKYDYMNRETSTHYFVSIVGRIIGLNKCSVEHNEKEKTMNCSFCISLFLWGRVIYGLFL
jgi:hypothetical protein